MRPSPRSALLLGSITLAACAGVRGEAAPYDIVIANGRVMDPESGLDAVRHLGISGGKITAVSEGALPARSTLDATGLVVAPGFIDMHQHLINPANDRCRAA